MCLAQDRVCPSEAHAKALWLLKAQLERWRNALPTNSLSRRKTDWELLRAYMAAPPAPPTLGSASLAHPRSAGLLRG